MSRAAFVEERLLANRFAGGVAPDYDGYGLTNVPASILRHFGLEPTRPALAEDVLPWALLDGAERIVLVVVDGLGWAQFLRSPLARTFPEHAPITSVLPSTTVAALATLSSGEPPGTHGLLGYRTLLPRLGAVTNLIRMQPYYASQTAFDLGLDPESFFPFDSLVGRLKANGVEVGVVTRSAYTSSPISRMIYRDVAPDGYVGLGDVFVRARRFLDATRGKRAFLEVYWDEIDTVAHRFGPGSDEHEASVRALAAALESELLPAARDGKAVVLLTADHGHVHVPRENVLSLNDHPRLLENLVLPPTGEGRFAYLHVRDGQREAVRLAFEDAFPGEVEMLDVDEVVASGRFGTPPHHVELLLRAGTLVAVPLGARKFEYHATPFTGPAPLLGNHGGADPAEMLVPLAVLRPT